MIKITKKTEYALMILKYMDSKPLQVMSTAREISDELKTPYDTTAKAMQALKQAKLLSSIQGVKGGYSIARPLSEVNYLEFTTIVGEKGTDLQCVSGTCNVEESCNISDPMKRLNLSLANFYKNLSLKELLA